MNTADLLPALNTVEQDHRLVLDKMRDLKETAGYLLDPKGIEPRQILERLHKLHHYFNTQFTAHLEEEETTLFPLLAQHPPEGSELVARLRREHAEIRRRCEELGNCLGVADELNGELPPMALRDLVTYGWELWELLDDHARTETHVLHRYLAQTFDDDGGEW
jgi:iron-sulfur cluster repair protein YtfE (RIC family)